MCNVYEPAPIEYLDKEWRDYERSIRHFKPRIGPRDSGPFVTKNRVAVGQWGMIPPFSAHRIPMDRNGRALATNNARIETIDQRPTFRDAWKQGKRCLIPATLYIEPYWGTGKNIWWRFARADGEPWTLAGLWNEWRDKETGEFVPNYTMLTMNCDAHPLLNRFHKPDPKLPDDQQDKRSVIQIDREHWEVWLNGTIDEAKSLVRLPPIDAFAHRADDPAKHVELAIG